MARPGRAGVGHVGVADADRRHEEGAKAQGAHDSVDSAAIYRRAMETLDRGDLVEQCVRLYTRVAQLETALQSRVVIEQAKGILAERLRLRPDDAFQLLRIAARSDRMKLASVARNVVESTATG